MRPRVPVNLLPKRVRHHNRDTDEPDDSREPAQRQPRAREHSIKSIFTERPYQDHSSQDRYSSAANVPCARERIALVNVPPNRVSLIAKHKPLRRPNLAEVFDRIDTHERTCRTILFTRVRLAPRTRRIERRVFAKIALDRDRIVRRIQLSQADHSED